MMLLRALATTTLDLFPFGWKFLLLGCCTKDNPGSILLRKSSFFLNFFSSFSSFSLRDFPVILEAGVLKRDDDCCPMKAVLGFLRRDLQGARISTSICRYEI
jgi:hypothetical protein